MLVSIVTPTYNSGKHICSCISSVANQSHAAIEQIIIDNNSTDNTLDVISNNRTSVRTVVSEPDAGIYDAMNKGIANANGSVIGILNSDDYYTDTTVIETIVSTFERHNVDVVYGNIDVVSAVTGRRLRHWRSSVFRPGSFAQGWHPPHPGFFVRRSIYARLGGYDLDLPVAADFEFMLRCLEIHRAPSCHIDRTLVTMRHGGESTGSFRGIWNGHSSIRKAFKKHNLTPSRLYTIRRLLTKTTQFFERG